MHIYFSGIGGTAIGPLALIAKQAGHTVSGSDKQDSQYIQYLRKQGLENIQIGQNYEQISEVHDKQPIDWFVYTSALPLENPDAPELKFCQEQNIRTSKRDELLNLIIKEKDLKLIAVAGTHGKTTTTAMVIWLFKELGIPISYSVGAKISFGDMGQYQEGSEYFVYECDEFDRNFLAFKPHLSLITGVTWDHHEIFPTREDYQKAFKDFIKQSQITIMWRSDALSLKLESKWSATCDVYSIENDDPRLNEIKLPGELNRADALLAIDGIETEEISDDTNKLISIINRFPGLQRRMEDIAPNLYSDYAHTPEKIRGAMSVALEMAAEKKQRVVVVYEPLTNRRQHYMIDDYGDCFAGASKVYWIPSYLAREDKDQRIIPPAELISHLADPTIAEAYERDAKLKAAIQSHLDAGDMVVGMVGGGGNSLDDWLREEFKA
jgi:UDP-N-acetylmuramate--alanine ligase